MHECWPIITLIQNSTLICVPEDDVMIITRSILTSLEWYNLKNAFGATMCNYPLAEHEKPGKIVILIKQRQVSLSKSRHA